MGILSGNLSARRYLVEGDLPADHHRLFGQILQQNAFTDHEEGEEREIKEGWVLAHNLLETDFQRYDQWLYPPYALFSFRMDKRTIPASYFRALLDQQVRGWCLENQQERCPSSVRSELREQLEDDLLKRVLPTVKAIEISWNLAEGWLIFHNASDKTNERFQKFFHQCFGLALSHQTPLDLLESDAMALQIEGLGEVLMTPGRV